MAVRGRILGRDVIQTEGQHKIMFFYTVQFVSTLHKGSLIFWSQSVLYLTVFTILLLTQWSIFTI